MVQCPRHNIPKVLHRRCSHFQNPASARRTELSVKCRAAPIVCFVDRGLLGFGSIGEGGNWDFGCQTERRSEEFLVGFLESEDSRQHVQAGTYLAILAVAERSAGIIWRHVNGVLQLAAVAASFVNRHCKCRTGGEYAIACCNQ